MTAVFYQFNIAVASLVKARRTYVQAQPVVPTTSAVYALPKRVLCILLSIALLVSFTPLPSYAETNVSLPGNITMLSTGSSDGSGSDSTDSSAIAGNSASATASAGDGAEFEEGLAGEVIGPLAASAESVSREGGTISVDGQLNLIQTGNWWPPAGTSEKDLQFGVAGISDAKSERMKNRLNTTLMNPPTSGTTINVDITDLFDFSELSKIVSAKGFKTWLEEVINSNPDLFYVSNSYSFNYDGMSAILKVKLSMSASSIASYRTKYENAMQTAMTWIPANANDFQKAKAAHDWIVRNVGYHTQAANIGGSSWQSKYGNTTPWTAYGAFVDKKAVCEGYSLAFMGILRRVGLDSTFVTQWQGSSGHGWNRAKLGGKWYNIDVTFDDPVPDRGFSATPSTTYFVKSDKWFKAHPTSGWHTSWSPVGTAGSDTSYDSFNFNSASYTFKGAASGSSNPTSLMVTTPANTKASAPYTMLVDSKLQLAIGTTQNASVQPGRATWKSSNPSVVAVNSGGTVTTGKKTGSATITVKLGNRTAYCYIKVVASGTQMSSVSKSIIWTGNTSYTGSNVVKYSGQNVKPKVNLSYQGKTLVEGKDYTLSYSSTTDGSNCVLPGVCTITVYGANGYIGNTTLTYTIRADLAQCTINKPSVAYTGAAAKPTPTLKFKTATLKAGTDFTVSYPSNASSVGTKTATVTGKGAYMGTKTFTYTVTPGSVANASVTFATTHAYTGKAITPVPTVKVGGNTLVKDRDYTVTYSNNIKETQKAVMNIIGKGNFTGKKVCNFSIVSGGPSGGAVNGSWSRLAGSTALNTMQAITKAGFAKSNVVIIATNSGYWDALAASSLAGANRAPVLLTKPNALSAQTASEIRRMGATKAYICGGTGAVSATTEKQIRAALSGSKSITRLAGKNALDTAVKIGNQVGSARSDTCIIATSNGYWDALSMAPYSYYAKAPIYLCSKGVLNSDTLAAIRAGGYKRAIIAGGTAAVSAQAVSQLRSAGIGSITRLAGNNAYLTSGNIANWSLQQGLSANNMAIATGNGYWDALCGAALCGAYGSVLVLVGNNHTENIDGFIRSHRSKIYHGFVFGGTSAVSSSTLNAAYKLTKK